MDEKAIEKIEDIVPNKSITVNLKSIAKILGVVLPIVLTSSWYQNYQMAGRVAKTTNTTIDSNLEDRFNRLENRVDSSQKKFESKQMAANMFSDGVAEKRGLTRAGGAAYIMKMFDFADAKVVEDSIWQNELKPMLLEMFAWYATVKDDCAGVRVKEGKLYFVDCDGVEEDKPHTLREMTYGIPNEKRGKWTSKAWYYRDKKDNVVALRNLKSMVFWAEH